jgi:mono/diheme cytochrome c family protein
MNLDKNPEPPKRKLLLGVSVVFVVLAAAGSIVLYATRDWNAPAAAKNLQNPVPSADDSITAGMMNYSTHCQSCHGERGDGKGERAEKLSIAPSDLTDAHAMSLVTDGELFWKISHGRRPMPAFQGKLTEQERWQLVDYIRTLGQKPASGAAPAAKSTSQETGAAPKQQ